MVAARLQPHVAVVMPVHNAERFVAQAIESILAQSHERLTLVIVDDGSTDDSWAIIQRFRVQDPRIKALRNETNQGIVRTRNRALDEAPADAPYLAIMDSDDVSEPRRLEQQASFLNKHRDHALVGTNLIVIDEDSRVLGRRVYPSSYPEIKKAITRYNPIAQPSVMVRRAALDVVGRYDERYPRCQDYDLWLRMAARFPVANLPDFALRYRLSALQGKSRELKESLRLTLQIQGRWMFAPGFFRPWNVASWGLQHLLLPLPDPAVLWLFKRVAYRRSARNVQQLLIDF